MIGGLISIIAWLVDLICAIIIVRAVLKLNGIHHELRRANDIADIHTKLLAEMANWISEQRERDRRQR